MDRRGRLCWVRPAAWYAEEGRNRQMIDRVTLADLLTSANRYTPPKPEALTALGKMIEVDPAFFNVEARLTRFDVDRDGKPRSGYGFTAQVEQNPIYELAFCIA